MVKPRPAQPTVKFIDTYCKLYEDLFIEVRAYEYFKYLHMGIISDIKRKSLPEIAKVVGLENAQKFQEHDWWDSGKAWKSLLNNLRLILQPSISFNLIKKWLQVFSIPQLSLGFLRLITLMNEFDCLHYFVYFWDNLYYSSA